MKGDKNSLYEKYISTHFQYIHPDVKKEFALYYRYFKKNYNSLLPMDKEAKILDVGCGIGHFLNFLKEEGYGNTLGIDISKECVNFCKQIGFNVIEKDALAFLEETDEYFDCIVMNDIIEHFTKDEIIRILKAAEERLSNNGKIIIKTENMANPITGIRSRYVDFTHEIGFSEESLSQVLRLVGFQDVKVYPQDIYVLKNPIINFVAKATVMILHKIFFILFLLHGATSTRIFTKTIIAVGSKKC